MTVQKSSLKLNRISGNEFICQCRRHRRGGFHPRIGKFPWRREWQPTPVFLPGKSHGQRSLAGYNPWGRKELDMTELTKQAHHDQVGFIPGILGQFNTWELISEIHHINRMKKKPTLSSQYLQNSILQNSTFKNIQYTRNNMELFQMHKRHPRKCS